jgi:hypothetical protein
VEEDVEKEKRQRRATVKYRRNDFFIAKGVFTRNVPYPMHRLKPF